MRFQIRLFFIFLSLLVILPVFLLTTQPALAAVSHIVRLKYADDDSPVVGAKVILHTWGYRDRDNNDWDDDCDWSGENGPNWEGTSDEHGVIVFDMTSQSPSGNLDHKIQRCSTGHNRPAMMAVVYLDEHNGGYWRFDQLSPDRRTYPRDGMGDDRNFEYAAKNVASEDFGWLWEMIKTNAKIDPHCNEDCAHFNDADFGYFNNFGRRGNVVKANINRDDGPGTKGGNFYWEWIWVGPRPLTQNLQNQPLLAFANNLWSSILNIFPKKLI